MNILIFSHLTQIEEYAEYIRAFKKAGRVQSLFLTMGEEELELGQKVGAFDTVKDILPAASDIDGSEEKLRDAARSLKDLETRLGSRFVNKDLLMDRYFRGQRRLDIDLNTVPVIWTAARTKQFMAAIAKRLEEEIARFKPDFIFVETNYAPGRMAWRLGREKGVPAGVFMPVRFWPDRVYLEFGLGHEWPQARQAYADMLETPMTGDELATVEARLRTIVEKKVKPAYMRTDHAKGSPGMLKRLKPHRLLDGFRDWLGPRARSARHNPRVLPGELYSPLAKYARYKNGKKAKRYLREHEVPFADIENKKYAVYFLHVQPELTVEEMAFAYQDQVNTLRNVQAALPADMYLVVKEHLPMLGYRPHEVYSQLAHMPGIIIADTREDSHKLIANASVVVTLTGTVALESVFYGIPTIVLGSIFFEDFAGIYKPGNLAELDSLLADPEQLRGATQDEALRALGCMLRASSPGKAARVDMKVQQPDSQTAKIMMSQIELIRRELSQRSEA